MGYVTTRNGIDAGGEREEAEGGGRGGGRRRKMRRSKENWDEARNKPENKRDLSVTARSDMEGPTKLWC
jgi:hypothetical protein